jgi:hypothetical protein
MCISCAIHIEDIWLELKLGRQDYRTPDHNVGEVFSITEVNEKNIHIKPQNITISKESFISALHYLRANHHGRANPCEIKSSNDREHAGPLCRAARDKNNDVRCINYILPILRNYGLVGISGNQPNSTWLVNYL